MSNADMRAATPGAHAEDHKRFEALNVVSKQKREVWRVARRDTPRSAVALACALVGRNMGSMGEVDLASCHSRGLTFAIDCD